LEEVMVQGNHIGIVVEVLMGKGVPKKWIETSEASGKKK
jgi:translation initiation factor 2D